MEVFAGIDNSSLDHKMKVVNETGKELLSMTISNDLSGFNQLDKKLCFYSGVKIGFELPHGPIVDYLKAKNYCMYSLASLVYYKSDGNRIYSNSDFQQELIPNNELELKIGKLLDCGNDSYSFLVYGFKVQDNEIYPYPLLFNINKIKGSIFQPMNDKYEITSICRSNIEMVEDNIVSKQLSYISIEKKYIYGLIDFQYNYVIGGDYKSKVNNLRMRSNTSIENSSVTGKLKKQEVVTLISIGEYAVISEVGGNWLEIQTSIGTTGWCFGAYLEEHLGIPDEL
jgi:hypothetical protein